LTIYFVDMMKALLPERVGQKYLFILGEIFERLAAQ
jgi:hypothetical protein